MTEIILYARNYINVDYKPIFVLFPVIEYWHNLTDTPWDVVNVLIVT